MSVGGTYTKTGNIAIIYHLCTAYLNIQLYFHSLRKPSAHTHATTAISYGDIKLMHVSSAMMVVGI